MGRKKEKNVPTLSHDRLLVHSSHHKRVGHSLLRGCLATQYLNPAFQDLHPSLVELCVL
jgi:hypothetical protein